MTQAKEKEYLLRGKTIGITASIENIIAGMILLTNLENPRDELIELKGQKLYEKVKKARLLIREFSPEIFTKANPILKKFLNGQSFRNRMAHCAFHWDDPTLLTFEIADIVEDPEGDYFDNITYSIDDAKKEVDKLEQFLFQFSEIYEMVSQKSNPKFLQVLSDLIRYNTDRQFNPPK